MNWLDKAIGFFNPKAMYQRDMWRKAMEERSAYDAGSVGRKNGSWTTTNNTAQQTDRMSRDIIKARARDMERNSDIAESIIGPFVRNVVGAGMTVQAKVRKKNGEDDEELNEQLEDLFEEWSRAKNCDITGQQSFEEMQEMAMRRLIVDGGIIFIKVYTNDGLVPFKLQVREVDELDSAQLTSTNGNRVVDGIEFDKYNKPVAYYFRKYSTEGYYIGESERIEAKRVIYLWKKTRPTQIREMSQLAKTVTRVRDINEFVEAVSVKERILACLSIFITKNNAGTAIGRGNNADNGSGYDQMRLTPGMIYELNPGEQAQAVVPTGQASNAEQFIRTQQRLAGSGQGLSYEATSRDMSQVNYSSARQGLLEDQRTYGMWQKFLVDHLCKEVYTEFAISAVLSGLIDIKDFWKEKRKYLRHEWVTPGWSWIDPLKEVKANAMAIETGLDTMARVCAERGLDWREVLTQRKKERDLMKEYGLISEVNYEGEEEDGEEQK